MKYYVLAAIFVLGFGLGFWSGISNHSQPLNPTRSEYAAIQNAGSDHVDPSPDYTAPPVENARKPESAIFAGQKESLSSRPSQPSLDTFWDQVGLGDVPAETAIQNLVTLYTNRKFQDIEQIESIVSSPEFYEKEFIDTLMTAYLDASEDSVRQGFKDLVFLADNEEIITAIGDYANSFDKQKQMASLALLQGNDLSKHKDIRESVYTIIEQAQDPDVVSSALNTLSFMAGEPKENEFSLRRVEDSMSNQNEKVRAVAVAKLIEMDKGRSSQSFVRSSLTDSSPTVQYAALDAIANNQYITNDIKQTLLSVAAGNSEVADGAKTVLEHHFALTASELVAIQQ